MDRMMLVLIALALVAIAFVAIDARQANQIIERAREELRD